jgi:uncharacterized protein (TIGR00159 family)
LFNLSWLFTNSLTILDFILVLLLTYLLFLIIGERRILWMVRGLVVLIFFTLISNRFKLILLSFVLEKLVLGAAVAIAVTFQSQLRHFLEKLGRGEIKSLFQSSKRTVTQSDNLIDEIVDAVKDLSQNRTGALIIIETFGSIDERDFSVPGVFLDAEVSKELLQTIFQTSTLLHDGAIFIRGSRIISAGVILPLSERTASRKLGTRHRAAMGITERVENCICVVVSEETGSISLAERGNLNRPLTSSKLKELLESQLSSIVEREIVGSNLSRWSRQITSKGQKFLQRIFSGASSNSQSRK